MENYEFGIGENIREVRKTLGYSQDQLAKKCDFSNTTLSAYERSKKIPNVVTLGKIAQALNTSIDRLYFGDDSKAFINRSPDEGWKIVNCIYELWNLGVLVYYESPLKHDVHLEEFRNFQDIFLRFSRFEWSIRRLLKSLNEYREKIKTYDDPEQCLQIIMSSVANEINTLIAEEGEGKTKKPGTSGKRGWLGKEL